MKSAPSETTETLHRVRQQLILSQVRIMELEDARDSLTGTLTSTEQLLAAAQNLADKSSEEAGNVSKAHADLLAQFEYLRHMQHVTNEALNSTRTQLTSTERDHTRLQQEIAAHLEQAVKLNLQIAQLKEQCALLDEQLSRVRRETVESNATAATRLDRISALETHLRAIQATKSWRWTAWMRSIGRTLGRGKP